MKKYRKKPVVIEAVQFTGRNQQEIRDLIKVKRVEEDVSTGIDKNGNIVEIIIPTLEGNMKASLGDYIIKGIKGEFYPCKPDIFEQTYEEVTNA